MSVTMQLSDYLRPTRFSMVVMSWDTGNLLITRQGKGPAKSLNAGAAFIWQLCDGKHTVKDIVQTVADTGAQQEGLAEMVSASIEEMFYQELVDLKVLKVQPLIRLRLSGFGEDFDIFNNIFINTLINRFDLLLVDENEQADLEIVKLQRDGDMPSKRATLRFLVVQEGLIHDDDFDMLMFIEPGDFPASVPTPSLLLPADYLISREAMLSDEARHTWNEFFSTSYESAKSEGSRGEVKRKRKPRLTIGMATYDDYDGVYFSIQAIHMYHPEVLDEIEFLVVDNHPQGGCSEDLKGLGKWLPNYRYIPNDKVRGTAIRDVVFSEARAEYVLAMDCHVFIVPGALARLLDYFNANPNAIDLLQGPLVYDDLKTIATHFEPVWRNGIFGAWATDDRGLDLDAEPFDIPMQGMGLSCCRRDAWPGYNSRLKGFGAEEGYVHQQFRNRGARTLCLPFLRWMHRFARPMGTHYENSWEDRIRNYLITFEEVGLDTKSIYQHFKKLAGELTVERVRQHLVLEKENPFDSFDVIYCINKSTTPDQWSQISEHFWQLGIFFRVRNFSGIDSKINDTADKILSHRAVVIEAADRGYKNVLVFEDDAVFSADILARLQPAVDQLASMDWQVFSLSSTDSSEEYEQNELTEEGMSRIKPDVDVGTRAIVYDKSIYQTIIDGLPDNRDTISDWLKMNGSLGTYLSCLQAYTLIPAAVKKE